MFGLSGSDTLTDGYLAIQTNAAFDGGIKGHGLTAATLQIHGDADLYTTDPSTVTIAQLYSDTSTGAPYPAVVAANYGSGQAAAFTYDLASNVVYTRQGNPANADQDIDGDYVVRTVDLFQTAGGGAPWIDRDKIPIPQAGRAAAVVCAAGDADGGPQQAPAAVVVLPRHRKDDADLHLGCALEHS